MINVQTGTETISDAYHRKEPKRQYKTEFEEQVNSALVYLYKMDSKLLNEIDFRVCLK